MPNPVYRVLIDWDDDGDFDDALEDATLDVLGEINIEQGRSDIHGSLNSASLEFMLANYNRKYSPDNTASPIFGLVTPHKTVRIEVDWDGQTFERFTGKITGFQHDPTAAKPTVAVYCEDLLTSLAKHKLDYTAVAPLTYAEIFQEVLEDAGLTSGDFEIDPTPDDSITSDVVFENVFAADILAVVAQAGFHFYYIDGLGKIRFKHRHWSMGEASFRTYFTSQLFEPNVESAIITYDDREILNDILIVHPDGDVTDDDATSQSTYGVRSATILNAVISASSQAHATSMADYLVDYFKDLARVGSMAIISLFPDVLQITPGKVVKLNDAVLSIDDDFVVMGYNERINVKDKEHVVDMRLQEWKDLAFTKVFADDDTLFWDIIGPENTTGRGQVAQTFKGQDGIINQLKFKMEAVSHTPGFPQHILRVQELDGGGLPDGTDLLVTEPFEVDALDIYTQIVSLSGLDTLKDYGILVDWAPVFRIMEWLQPPEDSTPIARIDAPFDLAFEFKTGNNADPGTVLAAGKLTELTMWFKHVNTPTFPLKAKVFIGGSPPAGGTFLFESDPVVPPDSSYPSGETVFIFPPGAPALSESAGYYIEIRPDSELDRNNTNYYEAELYKNRPIEGGRSVFSTLRGEVAYVGESVGWVVTAEDFIIGDTDNPFGTGSLIAGNQGGIWGNGAGQVFKIGTSPSDKFHIISVGAYGKVGSPPSYEMWGKVIEGIINNANEFNIKVQTPLPIIFNSAEGIASFLFANSLDRLSQGTEYSFLPFVDPQLSGNVGPLFQWLWDSRADPYPDGQGRERLGNTAPPPTPWTNLPSSKDFSFTLRYRTWLSPIFSLKQETQLIGEVTRVHGGPSTYADGSRLNKQWDGPWTIDAVNDLWFEVKGW